MHGGRYVGQQQQDGGACDTLSAAQPEQFEMHQAPAQIEQATKEAAPADKSKTGMQAVKGVRDTKLIQKRAPNLIHPQA